MPIPKVRHIPAWVGPFLFQIKQGKSEKVAANLARVGTADIRKMVDKDPKFKTQYEEAWDKRPAAVRGV